MDYLAFSNKLIAYENFLNDIAARVVEMLRSDRNDPEFISQRKAFKLFGRRNVERWRREGKIQPSKRPGRLEYPMARLRLLQRTKQDYFKDEDDLDRT